jgi:hypothetical protein
MELEGNNLCSEEPATGLFFFFSKINPVRTQEVLLLSVSILILSYLLCLSLQFYPFRFVDH